MASVITVVRSECKKFGVSKRNINTLICGYRFLKVKKVEKVKVHLAKVLGDLALLEAYFGTGWIFVLTRQRFGRRRVIDITFDI